MQLFTMGYGQGHPVRRVLGHNELPALVVGQLAAGEANATNPSPVVHAHIRKM